MKWRMGEKLELKLKSPVGAEPASYPWPLPVYVSVQLKTDLTDVYSVSLFLSLSASSLLTLSSLKEPRQARPGSQVILVGMVIDRHGYQPKYDD